MTMRDTLLNVIVYCQMARAGIADSSEMMERIACEIAPWCESGISGMLHNKCVGVEQDLRK